eukprot:gene17775-21172_t
MGVHKRLAFSSKDAAGKEARKAQHVACDGSRCPFARVALGTVESKFDAEYSSDAVWTINNRRYDLSSFVDQHPAGKLAILLGRGRNCTELFESYHSLAGDAPRKILERYYVGDAQPGDPDHEQLFDWDSTPFYDACKQRVIEHFADGRSYKAPPGKWLWLAAATSAFVISLHGFLTGCWWSLIALPVSYWLGPSSLLHDGMHWSLTSNARLNVVLAYLGSCHMPVLAWLHQHVIGHHSYTNIHLRDPDLEHFNGKGEASVLEMGGDGGGEAFYGFRLHPKDSWRPTYAGWKGWLAVMAPLTTVFPSLFESQDMIVPALLLHSFLGISVHSAVLLGFWPPL